MAYDLSRFRGVFPAALTMFDRENNLDLDATAKHWDWLIRQGSHGLVIAGTSGEFIAMENSERVELFRLAKQVTAGRVPLVYGAGHYSTKLTIDLCNQAQTHGADAVIVILPYYMKPPKAAVIRHYRDIRKAVDVPIMLYNNPGSSGCVDLSPREIAELVEEDVLHMVKQTYESVVPVRDLRYLVDDRMRIFYGSFQSPFEAMLAGAHGWISGVLNVIPRAAGALYRACVVEKNAQKGWDILQRTLPLVHLMTHQLIGPVSDLAIYRAILNLWGLQGGYSRNPFYPLSDEQQATLRRILTDTGWMNPDHVLDGVA